jgi:hypothetical protein
MYDKEILIRLYCFGTLRLGMVRIQNTTRVDDARICRFCDWSSSSGWRGRNSVCEGVSRGWLHLHAVPSDELIARLVKNPNENGYTFEIVGCPALDGQQPNLTYHVIARPLHSGLPAFCSDSSGVVMSDETGSVERCMAHGVPLNN